MRLGLLGSPAAAVVIFEALKQHDDISWVIAQPPRKAGRGRHFKPCPVQTWAQANALSCYTPEKLRSFLPPAEVDVLVVVAYGQILTQSWLECAPHGALNLHFSLLPRWRGASPVAQAILHGDQRTGISLMKMDAGLDTGPILAQESFPTTSLMTTGELTRALASLAASKLSRWLSNLSLGSLLPQDQSADRVTLAPKLDSTFGHLSWKEDSSQLARQVRAASPWPVAHAFFKGEKIRVLKAVPIQIETTEAPGTLLSSPKKTLWVATGKGILSLTRLQRPGKRPLDVPDFLSGFSALPGQCFDGK